MRTGPLRLGLVAASPMYYQAPLYRRLASDPRIDFTAIFASDTGIRPADPGYGQAIAWDVDILGGYRYRFLRRAAQNAIGGGYLSLFDSDVLTLVRRLRFDALWVHGYAYATLLLATAAQLTTGGALLMREEQTLIHPRRLYKHAAKHALLRPILARAHCLYIGEQNRRWFQSLGVPDCRLHFTPYCTEGDRMAAEVAERRSAGAELRRRLGLPPDVPVIVTVSRLIPKKRTDVVIEAFRRVRSRRPCALLIAGSGPCRDELERQVASAAIPDVVFTGFLNQSRVADAYAAGDMFTLASDLHETWGLVVNEAMAAGLPVVVSDRVGCAVDLVAEGVNGHQVAAGDPAALAERLEELVADTGKRRRMGAESARRIQPWNHDHAAEGVLSALRAAVGERRWMASAPSSDAASGARGVA